jgi:hypothetical protein
MNWAQILSYSLVFGIIAMLWGAKCDEWAKEWRGGWEADKRKHQIYPDEFPWGYPEWSEN